MDTKQIKYELQNLISGKSGASYDALIQTAAGYLRTGKRTGPMAEEKHQNKAQETARLIDAKNPTPNATSTSAQTNILKNHGYSLYS